MKYLVVLVVLFQISQLSATENNTFVATKEWQEIKEGVKVPSGLHYRINLETGKKEAKILEDDDEKTELSTIPKEEQPNQPKPSTKADPKIINESLEDKLKKIASSPHAPNVKNKKDSIEKLKESFKDIKMDSMSDSEIITELVKQYKNISKTSHGQRKEFIKILDHFSYLVHQIDNALWFIDEGGLEQVILPMLVNQTDIVLRVNALRVLGALTQNNPKAKIQVFHKNFGVYVGKILLSSENSDELSTALYAFGGLLRKFPPAQKAILPKTGIKALVSILINDKISLKIKAKALTLITDLSEEQQHSLQDPDNLDRISQYKDLNFNVWLNENKFCEIAETLLIDNAKVVSNDIMEYMLQAMQHFEPLCYNKWSMSPVLRHALITARNDYQRQAEDYLLEIGNLIDEIIKKLYKNEMRDEL